MLHLVVAKFAAERHNHRGKVGRQRGLAQLGAVGEGFPTVFIPLRDDPGRAEGGVQPGGADLFHSHRGTRGVTVVLGCIFLTRHAARVTRCTRRLRRGWG